MIHTIFRTNTYIMSNMAPQYIDFNGVVWDNWEIYTRKTAIEKKVLFVITGVTGDLVKMYVMIITMPKPAMCVTCVITN